jgi:hypothetical protein
MGNIVITDHIAHCIKYKSFVAFLEPQWLFSFYLYSQVLFLQKYANMILDPNRIHIPSRSVLVLKLVTKYSKVN